MNMKKNSVSFILVHYHAPEITLRCARSIATHQTGFEKTIFIVDNGSTQSERESLKEGLEGVSVMSHILRSKENLGYAGAINFAVKKIKTTYVAIVNNDATIQDGWLDVLAARLIEKPDVGIVGGVEVDNSRRIHFPPKLVLKNLTTVSRAVTRKTVPVEFVSGSNMLIRREHFRQWRQDYFLYYEDIAACLDMWRAGRGVELVPLARINHQANTTTQSIPVRKWVYATRNRYRLGYEFLTSSQLTQLWLQGLKGDLVGSLFRLLFLPIMLFVDRSAQKTHERAVNALGRLGGFLTALAILGGLRTMRRKYYDPQWSLAELLADLHSGGRV